MNTLEAMEHRYSRRSYLDTPIDKERIKSLKMILESYNKESGLSIQLIENGGQAFNGITKSYGMFNGVRSFFALVGSNKDPDSKEKAGFYGELLVLEATKLGLGTCWVGGSFDRKHCPCTVKEEEALFCVITVGNVDGNQSFKEKAINKLIHRKAKPLDYFYTSDQNAPDWFLTGIKFVRIAPSAANRQPVHFTIKGGVVCAGVKNSEGYQMIDLGIAKAHFTLAAGGHFAFGNHGRLTPNQPF